MLYYTIRAELERGNAGHIPVNRHTKFTLIEFYDVYLPLTRGDGIKADHVALGTPTAV